MASQETSVGTEEQEDGRDYHEADLTRGMEHLRPYVSVHTSSARPPPSNNHTTTQDPSNPSTVYGAPSPQPTPHNLSTPRPTTNNPQKRTQPFEFGSRLLTSDDDIFAFNAWDHVPLDDAYTTFATSQYAFQASHPVPAHTAQQYLSQPEKFWDRFYSNNEGRFFKDRKWLFQEFPRLREVRERGAGEVTVLEVGAGAGNTMFPLLRGCENEGLKVWAVDFSEKAVQVMRNAPEFDERRMRAEVWDAAGTGGAVVGGGKQDGGVSLPEGLEKDSVDIVILIFIFSALSPSQWAQALRNIDAVLKPGGEILFRDYGRGDLAQVRFKKGRYLEDNFYVRGDGTRVYFFEEEELRMIFGSGRIALKSTTKRNAGDDVEEENTGEKEALNENKKEEAELLPTFEILNLATDRRMLVNRQRRLKMYRCWMQGRFRKPLSPKEEVT